MTCQLCLQDKKLLRKSHIVPDFMYIDMFDSKHFIIMTNLKNFKEKSNIPTGIYDKNILCTKCDNEVIGAYESYASKALHKGALNKKEQLDIELLQDENELKSIIVNNIDYSKFKLFILSILWRSSISRHKFFRNIKLSMEKEDELRRMIFEYDARNENDFPISVSILHSNSNVPYQIIVEPRVIKSNDSFVYVFLINGLFYHIADSPNHGLAIIDKCLINKENEMVIPILEKKRGSEYYDAFMKTKLRTK